MMKLTIFFLIFLVIPIVNAIEINDTTLNATGSNTIVKIFEWINVTNITIESNHILFFGFTKTSYIYNVNTATAVVLISSGTTDYNFTGTDTTFHVWRNAIGLPVTPPSGSGFTAGAEAGAVAFAAQTGFSTEIQCLEQEFIWIVDTCYHCNGVLVEDVRGDILCKTCIEGYTLKNGKCQFDFNARIQSILPQNFIDKVLNKIFPNNPLLALALIIVIIISIVGLVKNKEVIKRKWQSR